MPRPDARGRRRLDAGTRREAIVAAARAAFAEEPYDDVSVAALAARAGTSEALVYHYFESKGRLYASVLQAELDELSARQLAADAALPAGTSRRDRVRTALEIHLDHVQGASAVWARHLLGAPETQEALTVRRRFRHDYAERMAELLGLRPWPRHEYALSGFLGFVDGASLRWRTRGCPDEERAPLLDAALGALEGALGDWGG